MTGALQREQTDVLVVMGIKRELLSRLEMASALFFSALEVRRSRMVGRQHYITPSIGTNHTC